MSPVTLLLAATLLSGEPGAEPAKAPANPKVVLETSMGRIVVELDAAKAPKTVANFLGYVKSGHYDGTVFHRVIPGFMIQGGGMTADMGEKKTGAPIPNEADNGLKNERGTLAMARTSDPNSATAQFFINTVDNAGLNHPQPDGHGYAVFGKVVKGMDVVNAIRAVRTTRMGPFSDVPADPVTIDSVTLLGAK